MWPYFDNEDKIPNAYLIARQGSKLRLLDTSDTATVSVFDYDIKIVYDGYIKDKIKFAPFIINKCIGTNYSKRGLTESVGYQSSVNFNTFVNSAPNLEDADELNKLTLLCIRRTEYREYIIDLSDVEGHISHVQLDTKNIAELNKIIYNADFIEIRLDNINSGHPNVMLNNGGEARYYLISFEGREIEVVNDIGESRDKMVLQRAELAFSRDGLVGKVINDGGAFLKEKILRAGGLESLKDDEERVDIVPNYPCLNLSRMFKNDFSPANNSSYSINYDAYKLLDFLKRTTREVDLRKLLMDFTGEATKIRSLVDYKDGVSLKGLRVQLDTSKDHKYFRVQILLFLVSGNIVYATTDTEYFIGSISNQLGLWYGIETMEHDITKWLKPFDYMGYIKNNKGMFVGYDLIEYGSKTSEIIYNTIKKSIVYLITTSGELGCDLLTLDIKHMRFVKIHTYFDDIYQNTSYTIYDKNWIVTDIIEYSDIEQSVFKHVKKMFKNNDILVSSKGTIQIRQG